MNTLALLAVAALVHAKDYGYNPTNATAALQQAIDSGAQTVVVDAMPKPWYIGKIYPRSHQTIRLAKGAHIHADLAQWETNKKKSLFCYEEGITDATLEGEDMKECLIGSFESSAQRKQYCKPGMELQTAVYIGKGATNIVVRKLSLAHCGCDGMGVGGWRIPSHNVLVEDVDMFDNHRQACSPMVADGLTFRRCHFRDTDGTEPGAGADMEPCYDVHPVKGVVFEDCEFGNNNGGGLITPLSSIFPIDVTVRRCTFHGEKGRSPISILARGDTYRNRDEPADVVFNFEDCVIESYWNDPAINIATAPIFTLHFKNCTIKEVPGWSWWRGGRVCSAIEFYLDRDYKGAFPPEKCGKITFENFKIEGFKGRPAIEFVDILGKQDVIGCMSGVIDFNGEKIDTSKINYKAMDVGEPLPRRLAVNSFKPLATHQLPTTNHQQPTTNLRLVPWGDWYEPRPCYNFYYWAEKGKKAVFSIAYPFKTDVTDFTKALKGVHQTLETPSGAVDLGELHPGTNRFEVVATATGWHSFFPPKQNGEGNNVRVLIDPSTPLAYQADSVETGDLKFEVRDAKEDYTGYFEVPPKVECRVRVSGGTIEIFDEKSNSVGKAEEGKYPGRKIITFTSSSDKSEVYSFKTPAAKGTRRMRFYAPLTSIFADAPKLLPRLKGGITVSVDKVAQVRTDMRCIGQMRMRPIDPGWQGNLQSQLNARARILSDGFKLKGQASIPNILGRTMEVRNFIHRGRPVRFYWLSGKPQSGKDFDFTKFWLKGEKFEHPVWIDARTGRVYEIAKKDNVWNVSLSVITALVGESPIIFCERQDIELVGDNAEKWVKPVPKDIVLYSGEPLHMTGQSVEFKGAWDLTENRTVRIELENLCRDGGTRIGVLDQHSGRSSAYVPASFKGTIDIDLLPPVAHSELRGMITGMQSDPFYRPTFSWTPEVQLSAVRDIKIERVPMGANDAPGGKVPELVIRKATALVTTKKAWPAWCAMDEKTFFPFIDKYGQFRHKTWPNKTTDDAQLKVRAAAEAKDLAAHPGPKDRDKFGGWTKGPQLKATGRFRFEKVNGKWWFVDPEGHLWWSHGVVRVTPSSAVTPLDGRRRYFAQLPAKGNTADPFEQFYHTYDELLKPYYDKRGIKETFDFSAANLYRKYGKDWRKKYEELSHRRLKSWGFNTIANSSDKTIREMYRTPFVERLETRGPRCKEQTNEGLWWAVPDPYSPEFRANLRAQLESNRAELTSPWCLGLFVDNEHNWSGISEKTMKEYFRVIREEIKRLDPKLLYFGCRFAHKTEAVVRACAAEADALSYNIYAARLDDVKLPSGIDKPILVGEFHFGCISDTGLFKPSLVWTPDQKHRAEAYEKYVGDALDHPNFVGTHWHQFSDQATTGRFDGENANTGFTDVCDTPYAEMVNAARKTGKTMYERRWKSAR